MPLASVAARLDAVHFNGLVEVYELRALQGLLQVLVSVQGIAASPADPHKVLQQHAAHLARRVRHEDLALQSAAGHAVLHQGNKDKPLSRHQSMLCRNTGLHGTHVQHAVSEQSQLMHIALASACMPVGWKAHLEVGATHYVWYCSAVVQVKVCDEHKVDFIEIDEIKVWQRVLARVSWMYPTVQHDALAPAEK